MLLTCEALAGHWLHNQLQDLFLQYRDLADLLLGQCLPRNNLVELVLGEDLLLFQDLLLLLKVDLELVDGLFGDFQLLKPGVDMELGVFLRRLLFVVDRDELPDEV